jgi:hypothetical protein
MFVPVSRFVISMEATSFLKTMASSRLLKKSADY